ncbi:MAG: cell wall hydrolase [Clostridia bacterium]|nr:cell wall hydrolase [Clostridia bacterium]
MKFIQKIARSRMCVPICGALSVLAIVYIGFAIRNIAVQTPLPRNLLIMLDERGEEEDHGFVNSEHEQAVDLSGAQTETFEVQEEIELPAAPMPEHSPSEYETMTEPEEQTKPPAVTQKPSQTTRPETQKPTEQITTKPPVSTQKPAQTTKPTKPVVKPQTPAVTGWNVTFSQAKGMVKTDAAYDYEDLYWLARIISAEAKGESFTGQIGVGTVVLNRVRSRKFPGTVKGVVFDRKYGTQFTPVANGTIYQTPTESAVIAAKMCLDGYTLSDSVLYFVNPRIATSSWIQNNRKYAFRIGNHDFYH